MCETVDRVEPGDDPACRPRRVLRVGRAAGRSAAARPAGHRRRGRGARRQLRGQGVRRAHGDGRRGRPGGCARRRSSSRRACRPTPRPARRCSRCSTTPRRWSRGSRSTRRSSTSAACGASPGTPAEIAARLRRDVREQVGLPITVGVARTKFLAKVASGVAKPDGLLVVPPDGELGVPPPAAGRAALGRRAGHRGQAPRPAGSRRSARWPRLGEAALVSMLGPASGRHLHALAHNRDPRPVRVGRRRGSIGVAARAGPRAAVARRRSTPSLVALVDRVTRRMRAAGRVGRTVVLRLRFDDFTRATRSHTLPRATAHTADDPRRRPRRCWRRRRR